MATSVKASNSQILIYIGTPDGQHNIILRQEGYPNEIEGLQRISSDLADVFLTGETDGNGKPIEQKIQKLHLI